MANRITYNRPDVNTSLKLSNGAMSVIVISLSLTGSHLAAKPHETDLIRWVASRDQNVLGGGVVGFDLSELPWSQDETLFDRQKIFLLAVVSRVKTKVDLPMLDYEPVFVLEHMNQFESMLNTFDYAHVTDEEQSWWLSSNEDHGRCKKHGVYQHIEGCIVCNESIPLIIQTE